MAAPDAPPDLALGPLALWVHGREDLAATDEQELNRLRVTARCEGQGAEVMVTGALLTTYDLDQWLKECAALERRPEGEATLEPADANLAVRLTGSRLGRIDAEVDITPDALFQQHTFRFQLEAARLRDLIQQLADLCRRHPVLLGGEGEIS